MRSIFVAFALYLFGLVALGASVYTAITGLAGGGPGFGLLAAVAMFGGTLVVVNLNE